jgi:hypothetical protein
VGLLAAARPAGALDLRAEVDRVSVPVGGQIVLRLTVSGAGQDLPRIRISAPKGFEAYSLGTSQNISILNGRVETSLTERFVLVAKEAGAFTIGPFEIAHGGETARTEAIGVEVVAGGAEPTPEPRRGGATAGRTAPSRERAPDYFVRAEVDHREAFVNEAITLTFRFYSRVRLSRDPEYTPPVATGFWIEDLPPVRRLYEDVSGVHYLVNELKYALFPTTTGELTIGPATLTVQSAADNPVDWDPFQMFGRDPFAGRRSGPPEVLRTDPIRIRVRALPEAGRPPVFSGLVGEYSLSARLDKSTVEANQPATLTLVLSGDGNLQTAPDPTLDLPAGVRSYDSGSRVNTSKEGYRLRGEKIVEKVLIPQASGRIAIPPATIVTFDPKAGRYRTLASDSLRLDVVASTAPVVTAVGGREVRPFRKDLRPIRQDAGALAPPRSWLIARPAFWVAQAIPLLLFVKALRDGRSRRALAGDATLARARGASRVARRRLREARRALDGRSDDRFYTLLAASLSEYAADKLGLSRLAIPREDLLEGLRARGVPDDVVSELTALLERCDMGRFAPGGDAPEEREGLLQRSEAMIVGMERRFSA